ncbi:hypothetical protein N0V84_009212 [Fusarium piperis]|uniref:Uncharacterized protein n=1 Tax=Fusarium piperis TaxID=1435070 RepID=A0A9W8W6Q0_9HYPO|nr:hypothetical protein N0V84_009212 [Fusarium piperis]
MVFALGVVLTALVALGAAKEVAPVTTQRLAVIYEKNKVTDTVLTAVYDIEDDGKRLHCAACSNKLTISDLKLDLEFEVDDYGQGTLHVSESKVTIDRTSKIVGGVHCSTSYSKSHLRTELIITHWIVFTTLIVPSIVPSILITLAPTTTKG